VGALFPAVDRAFVAARKNLPTPGLNRVLTKAVQAVPPPMTRGRRIKLKLAHQGGKNPPLIIIHGNQVKGVPDSYRRYLENTFRKAFKLEGTPVRIEFRQAENPYAGRKDGRQEKIHQTKRRQIKSRRPVTKAGPKKKIKSRLVRR
jgi:GTP-binding protein